MKHVSGPGFESTISWTGDVSDPGGVINIADPMTGTFVFIKLGYLKNFMPNECCTVIRNGKSQAKTVFDEIMLWYMTAAYHWTS